MVRSFYLSIWHEVPQIFSSRMYLNIEIENLQIDALTREAAA